MAENDSTTQPIYAPHFWTGRDRNDHEITIHAGGGTVSFMADVDSLSLTPSQARDIARSLLVKAEEAEGQ